MVDHLGGVPRAVDSARLPDRHGEFEIIQKKRAYKYFEDAVNYAFGKAKAHLKTGIEEKFIATIRIRFDIEPLEESQVFEYDFIRTASKVQVKTIKSHD